MRYKTKLDIEALDITIPPGTATSVLNTVLNSDGDKVFMVDIYPPQGGILRAAFGVNAFYKFFEPEENPTAVIA